MRTRAVKTDTRLVHAGRGPRAAEGTVNLPVYRASTILSPDLESYLERFAGARRFDTITYGATGTHNARALGEAVAALEGGGSASVVTASGLSAVTLAVSALVGSGDHALVTDSCYGPTRRFCDRVLTRFGVETSYYDPRLPAEALPRLLRPGTRVLYMESPGSLTFEMQDVPGLARVARAHGVLTLMDNTWATPLGFRPLERGVDVSIQAGTKYVAGHSDLVIGLITTAERSLHERIADHVMAFGDGAGPDECYLALRGLRTLGVRLRRQQASALAVAGWLARQPQVKRVLYPALEGDPGHAIFARDFECAASLFGVVLESTDLDAVKRMVDGLELFGIGSSWGGFESLVAVNTAPLPRAAAPWTEAPFLMRLHIGLEDPEDLIADLEAGLARL